ncbi:MAG: hypothetical protein IJ568_00965 [Bacilli bacterium]|nr:hypothetical protein [Bacilli bacterium]
MKDEKQLVLFFSKGTQIDGAYLASHLKEKFDSLKDPIVIPFNPKNINQPLILFNQGNIKLTITISDISFVYNKEDHEKNYNTIIEIIEYFEELDFSFERMGYISTFLHTKKERENFINNVFKDKDMIESEFQLSWYKKELIDSVSVNVWQRNMTDIINNVDFVTVFDINTPIDEVYNITSEFLKDFIKQCDKYMNNNDKKLK